MGGVHGMADATIHTGRDQRVLDPNLHHRRPQFAQVHVRPPQQPQRPSEHRRTDPTRPRPQRIVGHVQPTREDIHQRKHHQPQRDHRHQDPLSHGVTPPDHPAGAIPPRVDLPDHRPRHKPGQIDQAERVMFHSCVPVRQSSICPRTTLHFELRTKLPARILARWPSPRPPCLDAMENTNCTNDFEYHECTSSFEQQEINSCGSSEFV